MKNRFEGIKFEIKRSLGLGELEIILDNCKKVAGDTKRKVKEITIIEDSEGEIQYWITEPERNLFMAKHNGPYTSFGLRHEHIQRQYSDYKD